MKTDLGAVHDLSTLSLQTFAGMHHKDTTKNQKNNTMDKKNYATEKNSWLAHCWALSLAEQCYDREKQTQNARHSSYNGTIKQSTLSAVLADSAALIEKPLTIRGCFSLFFSLLKLAIKAKKKYHHYRIQVVVSASQKKEGVS